MQEARYWESGEGNRVRCQLCPHQCRLEPGGRGICRVRHNRDGVLYTDSYGQVAALALDPMEKKPLYHFFPGREVLSLGALGCNFSCDYCQNWEIARGTLPTRTLAPAEAVHSARELRPRCVGLSYTYSEPLVWYEYVLDTARLARERGLVNTVVTNGYILPQPWRELLPWVDAVNIDVKAWNEGFYRRLCSGHLGPVVQTVEEAHRAGCHLEVTTLLIPGENDDLEELAGLVEWLAGLDPAIPLHLSRYFPRHGFHARPTPPETLEQARQLAQERLYYVYLGNVDSPQGRNTYCPRCGQLLLQRDRGQITTAGIRQGKCRSCQRPADVQGLGDR